MSKIYEIEIAYNGKTEDYFDTAKWRSMRNDGQVTKYRGTADTLRARARELIDDSAVCSNLRNCE